MTTTYKRLAYSTAASSSGSGVTVYDSFSLLPAVATDGRLAVVADEDALYQYDTVTSAWILIGKKGVVYTVSDTDTIDLTITGNSLSAIVKAGGITSTELADASVTTAKLSNPTGDDTNVVTGTPGTANNFSMWNADGDLVDSEKARPTGAVVGTSDTQTLTNKTVGDALKFSGITPPAHQEGLLFYSSDTKTFSLYNDQPDVQLNLGEENWIKARNATGSTILNGKVVYVSGATGNRPRISLADSDAVDCCNVIGIVTHDIENNTDGYVTTFGEVRNLDTSAFSVGDILYLSTTAGELTNVYPEYPAKPIRVGYVLVSNPSNGIILVVVDHLQDPYVLPSYVEQTLDPTGFSNNRNITVTYSSVSRTITLNGTFVALYKGLPVLELVDGWESPAHAENPTSPLFLKYNGDGFTWSSTPWNFDEVLIAFVYYDTNGVFQYAQREVHGFIQHPVHRELHKNIGTYKESGGGLTNYTIGSTTLKQPDTEAVLVSDEDLMSDIAAHTDKSYSQMFFSGANGDVNFAVAQTHIVPVSGNQPYYNQFTGGAWQQTLLTANKYTTIWQIAIPTSADATSQAKRLIWIQGQSAGTLASQQALNPQDLNLNEFRNFAPEFVFLNKVIIRYTAGNWSITSVTALTGNRFLQIGSPAGNYLTSVTTDSTIEGNGTATDPLSIATALSGKQDVISGTPNEFAIYDGAGEISSNPTFIKNTDGGTNSIISRLFNSAVTLIQAHIRKLDFQPTEAAVSTYVYNRLVETNFNGDFDLFRAFSTYEIMRKQGTGAVQNFLLDNVEMNFNAGSSTGITALRSGYMSFGGGPNPTTTEQAYLTTDSMLVTSNHTYNGISGTAHNISLSGGSTGTTVTGFNSFIGAEDTAVVDSITSYSASANIENDIDYFTVLNSGPNVLATGTALGVTGFFFNPSFEGLVQNYSGVSLNGYGSVPPTAFSGVFVNPTYSAKLSSYTGFQVSHTCDIEDATGVRVQLGNGTDVNNVFCFDSTVNFDAVTYGRGISFQGTALDVVSGFDGLFIDMTGIVGNNVKAAQFTGDVVINGNLDLNGNFEFNGNILVDSIEAVNDYVIVSGSGTPSSNNSLISVCHTDANTSYTLADRIGVNTAMLLTLNENSDVDTALVGITALGLPGVITTHTGSNLDRFAAATFAMSMDASSTGGTIQKMALCRALAIPNANTTVDEFYGYEFDLPFGNLGTKSWGFYARTELPNYFQGQILVGNDTATNSSVGIELNSTTKAVLFSRMNQTQRDALTAVNGFVTYNSTKEKLQGYANGAWVSMNGEAEDKDLTSFAMSNNVSVAADITGLIFNPSVVRSFKSIITVGISATANLYESFTMTAVYNGTSWNYTIESEGDDSQVVLSVTNLGQVQYTSADLAGFTAGTITYRAIINT